MSVLTSSEFPGENVGVAESRGTVAEKRASTTVQYITGDTVDSTTTSQPTTTYMQEIDTAGIIVGQRGASNHALDGRSSTSSSSSLVTQETAITSTAVSPVYTAVTATDTLLSGVGSTSVPYNQTAAMMHSFNNSTMMNFSSAVDTSWPVYNRSIVDIITSGPTPAEVAEDTTARDVVLGALLTCLGVLTVFGNTLVILAIYRERCLRTVTNLFIASLACADFIIGSTVIPFAIYNELRFGQWVFGRTWCDVWHAIDILACTASIINLCVIAVDRYWAITRPMSYPSRMTKKLGALLIALVWICSSLISFPCIAWWHAVEPLDRPETDCVFPEDPTYLIISSCISFYIPSTLMIFMYAQVYRTAVEQVRIIRSGQRKVSVGTKKAAMSMRIHRGGTMTSHQAAGYQNGYIAKNAAGCSSSGSGSGHSGGAKAAAHAARKSILAGMNREHKAARTLGIVMGVFILCWLPFFVVNVMAPICLDCIVNPHITFPVVTWLGYANSALNPAIYAFTSRSFKRAFAKILCDLLPRRYQPVRWDKQRRPRRAMSMSNMEQESSYTMVEYGDMVVRSPDRKANSTTAILSGGRPNLYALRQTYF